MADDQRWGDVVEALAREGFPAELQHGFLGALTIAVDLGDGWSASLTTGDGDLRTLAADDDELQVALDGPDLPGEGYAVTWWPPTHDLRRLARDVAPLLRRLSAHAPAAPPVAIPAVIETVEAGTPIPPQSPLWGGGGAAAAAWIAEVESTPAFRAAATGTIVGLSIHQSLV